VTISHELILFAERFVGGAQLFAGEFHWGKGIMLGHGDDEKATSKESHGAPVPLWTRQSHSSRDADWRQIQERVLAPGL